MDSVLMCLCHMQKFEIIPMHIFMEESFLNKALNLIFVGNCAQTCHNLIICTMTPELMLIASYTSYLSCTLPNIVTGILAVIYWVIGNYPVNYRSNHR